ncbi:tetratricopeptide repeat protein [Reinekea marinisedimentorum]|uniref:Tfp pilus assembly protein PilF n=1 Tax=Reinekea marinisedimentorum TaxID=230495 RepID=A0A4R3I9H3_9GAMM|nr:tetratricopeptide repeat protein [Reinekea marinisedimentorum]TCS42030.1 Tfp pilus assembly protein PilF [Reinekea marinisedimentorum]
MLKKICTVLFVTIVSASYSSAVPLELENDSFSDNREIELPKINFDLNSKLPPYHSLSNDQKYALMLTSTQNGQFNYAIAIAKELEKVRSADTSIKALLAADLVQSGNYSKAETALSKLAPNDKYESALINLVTAILYYKNNDLEVAEKLIDETLEEIPRHPYAHAIKGMIAQSKGIYFEAKQSYSNAISYFDRMALAHINLANILFEEGDTEKALSHYNHAISIDQKNCNAVNGKARILYSYEQRTEAEQLLEECVSEKSLNSVLLKSEIDFAQKEYGKVVKLLTPLSKADLLNSWHRTIFIQSALKLNDLDSALNANKQATDQEKYLLAVTLMAQEDAQGANRIFLELWDKNESNVSALLGAVITSISLGNNPDKNHINVISDSKYSALMSFIESKNLFSTNTKSAIYSFNKAASFDENNDFSRVNPSIIESQIRSTELKYFLPGVYFYLFELYEPATKNFNLSATTKEFFTQFLIGKSAFITGDYEQAELSLNTALSTAPQYWSAQILLAETYLKLGEIEKSKFAFKKSINIRPTSDAYFKLGALYEKTGDIKRALEYYEQLVNVEPDNFIALNQLAWVYAENNTKIDRGIQLALRANQLYPNSPIIYDTLGWLYYKDNNLNEAYKWLDSAKNLSNSKSASVLYHLASAQIKGGQEQKARENINLLLEMDGPYKERAKNLLNKM